MANAKKITVTAGADEIGFDVGLVEFNTFQNEFTATNKVAPCKQLLRRTLANKEQAPLLETLFNQGLAVELAGLVANEFRPEIELEIKK